MCPDSAITIQHRFKASLLTSQKKDIFGVQVCEGLAFIHDSVKMIHRNISLGSIILNESGAWKIFGFDFCLQNAAPMGQPSAWTFPIGEQMMPASEFGVPGKISIH